MAGGVVSKSAPSPKEVRDFHTNADVDGAAKSVHHTLGPLSTQASPGNHSHDGGTSALLSPLEDVTITGSASTGDVTFRNSIVAALVRLGATNGTT